MYKRNARMFCIFPHNVKTNHKATAVTDKQPLRSIISKLFTENAVPRLVDKDGVRYNCHGSNQLHEIVIFDEGKTKSRLTLNF